MTLFEKQKKVPSSASRPDGTFHSSSSSLLPSGRSECHRYMQQLLDRQSHQSKGVALKLYIENFKRLNEIFGYQYCEDLLTQIISYLEEVSGCSVYRYIGMEFLIFLENTSSGQAVDLTDEILDKFSRAWKVNGTDCLCSIQIGLCSYPGHTFSADEMMKLLDLAILKASEFGPNQYAVYDSQMREEFTRKQIIAHYLQTALSKDEIEIHYRPVYDIEKERFTRAEFYMRIFIKGIGLVGASEFLPIAEDTGQIRAIEYYALDRVGACIQRLIDGDREFDCISLPVSSVLLLQEDFPDKIQELIDTYGIPEGKLALELREDAFTTAYLNINVLLQELSNIGVELILNEFGSGMSSMASILELPVNTLKLEKMFIWQLETNSKAAHVIRGLVNIARKLELNIIAEGVETENQLQVLTASGCRFQQGFYYCPTIKEELLPRILGKDRQRAARIIGSEK
ncbi:GGDEF domain-containing phosphodiesterase [Lachnospiraceae bacterium 62-35]